MKLKEKINNFSVLAGVNFNSMNSIIDKYTSEPFDFWYRAMEVHDAINNLLGKRAMAIFTDGRKYKVHSRLEKEDKLSPYKIMKKVFCSSYCKNLLTLNLPIKKNKNPLFIKVSFHGKDGGYRDSWIKSTNREFLTSIENFCAKNKYRKKEVLDCLEHYNFIFGIAKKFIDIDILDAILFLYMKKMCIFRIWYI